MKKTIKEVLNAFAINPIEARKVYNANSRRWTLSDYKEFGKKAMATYPNDTLKETANRLIAFLYDNELIDYECIGWDYLNFYDECDGDCDVGLKTFTIDYITNNYQWWLEDSRDDGADELRKAVEEAEQVWYWGHLLSYCVEHTGCERNIVKQVAQSTKQYVPC